MTSSGIVTKKVLSTLKLKDLKTLALSIGAGSSGTKDVLSSRLWEELHRPRLHHGASQDSTRGDSTSKTRGRKILSIDMGIKNFAYSTVSLPERWGVPFNLHGASAPMAEPEARPKLLEWNRLNMLTYNNDSRAQDADVEPSKDRFNPENLADFANHIIEHLVLSPKSAGGPPDTILIERQRFRTMGSSVVQEWTLRVNMLEAMLWAVLGAEKQRGTWTGEVHGVSPSLVAGWWQARDEVENVGSTRSKGDVKPEKLSAKQKKQVRIERAAECLRDVVEIADPASQATYEAYMRRMSRAKGQRTKDTPADGAHLQKLDDLADSLLQVLTWLVWEQNRRALLMTETAAEALHSFLPGG